MVKPAMSTTPRMATEPAAHRFFRRKFVKWGATRYISVAEMEGFLSSFSKVQYRTVGFAGAFGRSERQRNILGLLDAKSPQIRHSRTLAIHRCRRPKELIGVVPKLCREYLINLTFESEREHFSLTFVAWRRIDSGYEFRSARSKSCFHMCPLVPRCLISVAVAAFSWACWHWGTPHSTQPASTLLRMQLTVPLAWQTN
jgi:hypothetical protein